MSSRRLTVAIGAAQALDHDLALELGVDHPSQHGPWRLILDIDGEFITAADAEIGFMHRSAEKLFEVRDYRQALHLANRHDWVNPATSEIGLALAFEQALGLVPPERATWTRMLMAELTRIGCALLFTGAAVPDPEALALRARLVDLQESLTGSRVHPMYTRIGGIAHGLDSDALVATQHWLGAVAQEYAAIAQRSATRWAPLQGIASLPADAAVSLGVTGPLLRASGIEVDLRRDEPSLAYAEVSDLLAPIEVGDGGDIPARHAALVGEIPRSIAIARRCLDRLSSLGDAPFDVRLPKVVRLPEATTYSQFEGPLGVAGYLVDSAGDKVPRRLKLRTPAFAAVQALIASLPGVPLDSLGAAMASFFIVIGDADR